MSEEKEYDPRDILNCDEDVEGDIDKIGEYLELVDRVYSLPLSERKPEDIAQTRGAFKSFEDFFEDYLLMRGEVVLYNGLIEGWFFDEELSERGFFRLINQLELCFIGCTFEKQLYIKDYVSKHKVSFRYSTFNKKVIVTSCIFQQSWAFNNCTFSEEIDITSCIFQDNSAFNDCTFNKEFHISSCTFQQDFKCNHSSFKEIVDIYRCVFIRSTSVRECTFFGKVELQSCQFVEGLWANNADFHAGFDFTSLEFLHEGGASFYNATFQRECRFENLLYINNLYFVDVTILGQLEIIFSDFEEVDDIGADLSDLSDLLLCRTLNQMEIKVEWYCSKKQKALIEKKVIHDASLLRFLSTSRGYIYFNNIKIKNTGKLEISASKNFANSEPLFVFTKCYISHSRVDILECKLNHFLFVDTSLANFNFLNCTNYPELEPEMRFEPLSIPVLYMSEKEDKITSLKAGKRGDNPTLKENYQRLKKNAADNGNSTLSEQFNFWELYYSKQSWVHELYFLTCAYGHSIWRPLVSMILLSFLVFIIYMSPVLICNDALFQEKIRAISFDLVLDGAFFFDFDSLKKIIEELKQFSDSSEGLSLFFGFVFFVHKSISVFLSFEIIQAIRKKVKAR